MSDNSCLLLSFLSTAPFFVVPSERVISYENEYFGSTPVKSNLKYQFLIKLGQYEANNSSGKSIGVSLIASPCWTILLPKLFQPWMQSGSFELATWNLNANSFSWLYWYVGFSPSIVPDTAVPSSIL